MKDTAELRRLLGLGAEETLEVLAEHPRPPDPVGTGLARAARDRVRAITDYPPVPTELSLGWPTPLWQVAAAPDLFVTEVDRDTAVLEGIQRVLEDGVVEFDTSTKPAVLLHRSCSGDVLLDLHLGEARTLLRRLAESEELQDFEFTAENVANMIQRQVRRMHSNVAESLTLDLRAA